MHRLRTLHIFDHQWSAAGQKFYKTKLRPESAPPEPVADAEWGSPSPPQEPYPSSVLVLSCAFSTQFLATLLMACSTLPQNLEWTNSNTKCTLSTDYLCLYFTSSVGKYI